MGFEPMGNLRHAWFSRPARYDHFGTPPHSAMKNVSTFVYDATLPRSLIMVGAPGLEPGTGRV